MIKMLNAFDYGDCKTRPYACELCNCSNGTATDDGGLRDRSLSEGDSVAQRHRSPASKFRQKLGYKQLATKSPRLQCNQRPQLFGASPQSPQDRQSIPPPV